MKKLRFCSSAADAQTCYPEMPRRFYFIVISHGTAVPAVRALEGGILRRRYTPEQIRDACSSAIPASWDEDACRGPGRR